MSANKKITTPSAPATLGEVKKSGLSSARATTAPTVMSKQSSGKKLQYHKHALPKKDWSKICAMKGKDRRDFLSSVFGSNQYSDDQIARLMADEYNLQKIDFAHFELDPKIVLKVPRRICEKYCLIPIMEVEDTLIVAFSDPGDIQARDDLSLLTNSKIEMMVAERKEIQKMIDSYHLGDSGSEKMKDLFSIIESTPTEDLKVKKDDVDQKIKHDPTVQSVDYIIRDGIRLGCSDIHIEVYEQKCRVRYRVDGHLSEYLHPPVSLAAPIASRVKVMSHLDIGEKRMPQDGRLKVQIDNDVINFRVSTVPVVSGEKIVLRILDTSALGTDISELGMNQQQMNTFKKYLSVSQGLVLMTGPTGCGKTTTIYSGLQTLNTPDKNLSTAEDPVEYKLQGINQVQVNPKIGLTFASVLRSFLRQDPDVILVGEIRDQETANIAFRAAATGHLVLSTLHTNDAPSTITRLMDIGLPAYSVAENTSVVVAQRLLRVLCEQCKIHHKVNVDTLKDLGFLSEEIEEAKPKIMKPVGCQYCNHSGYKGRKAVFEVMEMSPELKAGVFQNFSPRQLKDLAIEKGNLQTLRRSALEKLKQGITSIDEVIYGTLKDK